MKHSRKIICTVVVLMLLQLFCSAFLPTSGSETINNTVSNSDTVTITREEYEMLTRYAELEEIRQIVENYYYEDTDDQLMMEYAAQGMLAALDDPYTFYYSAEDFAAMWEDDEGNYAGVGMQISIDYENDICTISRVFLNSPALEAGIRKGDILRNVEDMEVNSYNIQDAVNIMRGTVGESVHIVMERNGELLEYDVIRAQVQVNYVNSCMLENNIAYICLYDFSGDCSDEFENQLRELEKNGAEAVVLDLRDNPGGWLTDANEIADLFMGEGVLATLQYKDGSKETYTTVNDADDCALPLIVMVNENSASASEVLTGALQDRERATVVGVQSYGKGIVQWVLPVGSNGAGMQLTIASYYTPNGNAVHKIGITPDVIAELPEGDNGMYDLGDMNDPQLQIAYETALSLIGTKE